MKKYLFIIVFAIAPLFTEAQTYHFKLSDFDGNALNLVPKPYIISITKPDGSSTEINAKSDGVYSENAPINSYLSIKNVDGKEVYRQILGAETGAANAPISFFFNDNSEKYTPKLRAAATSKNYWVGAKVSYKLGGDGTEDIVGGSKIKINAFDIWDSTEPNALAVIGNVGTFVSNSNADDVQAAISKLAQSQTGLSIGLGYIRDFYKYEKDPLFKPRAEATINYRLNSFKDPNDSESSIALNQLRSTFTLEVETMKWKNEGAASLSSELSYSIFDKSTYKNIFAKEKGSIFSFETTLILPLSKNIGFMTNLILTKGIKPTYQFGISIKTTDE